MRVIFVILLAFIASSAWAEKYVKFDGGISLPNDSKAKDSGGLSVSYDPGGSFRLRNGVKYHNWRLESDLQLVFNSIDQIKVAGVGSTGADGNVFAYNLMGNIVYSFSPYSSASPYLGVGGGVSLLYLSDLRVAGTQIASDTTVVPAYQFLAGISVEMEDEIRMYVEYHYFNAVNPQFDDEYGDPFDTEYSTNIISIGIEKSF